MAYDGIITKAMVRELKDLLVQGKVDKIQQPLRDQLMLTIHTRSGNLKLFSSAGSSDPRLHLTLENPENPATPFSFCMLLRKHLGAARIKDVCQVGSDRIIEIYFEALNELGFTVSKKLVFEIMGKHSNIILVDTDTNKILDSAKRVGLDTSRARQVLPGMEYQYPPAQDKIPFSEISAEELASLPQDSKVILNRIGGISPQIAEELSESTDRAGFLDSLFNGNAIPHVYLDQDGKPVEFHIANLGSYEDSCQRKDFQTLSECVEFYFENRATGNRLKQQAADLDRHLRSLIEKNQLKLKRLNEDLLSAEDSDKYRLYGELLTANLHLIKAGADSATVESYYDGSKVTIPLDPKYSPSKNAQNYFKKFGKSKTAVKEKQIQIEETEKDLQYLESVHSALENAEKSDHIELIRNELVDEGFLKKRKTKEKPRKIKAEPHRYKSPSGMDILVGRNNKENDELTFRIADKTDIWLHTKDIPGSHVILRAAGEDPSAEDIYCAASIAAWHSKGKTSAQVPVDYVRVRHVKKPSGAKPGMVIFTDNRTVYVDPKLPD